MTAIVGGSSGITFPTWDTAGRPATPEVGTMGWNTDLVSMEVYDGSAWGAVGGGGGASADGAIYINTQEITANYTFTANTSGVSAGPVSLSNAVVTMPVGSRWVIV
jgi:hypothetical protein